MSIYSTDSRKKWYNHTACSTLDVKMLVYLYMPNAYVLSQIMVSICAVVRLELW